MEGFGLGMVFGAFVFTVAFGILGVAWIVPGWEGRVTTAKTQACEAAGGKLDNIQDRAKGGQCIKGNTIVLRFKD